MNILQEFKVDKTVYNFLKEKIPNCRKVKYTYCVKENCGNNSMVTVFLTQMSTHIHHMLNYKTIWMYPTLLTVLVPLILSVMKTYRCTYTRLKFVCYVIPIYNTGTAYNLEVLNKYDGLILKHKKMVVVG